MKATTSACTLLLLAAGLSVPGDASAGSPNECSAIPSVQCAGTTVERPSNTGTVVLKGNATATFPAFSLRADRLEITHGSKQTGSKVLVIADGGVSLKQGTQELRFRTLSFEVEIQP